MSIVPAILTAAILAQAPAAGPAARSIAGQVIDGGTGRPVGATFISIAGTAVVTNGMDAPARVLTGADGRFVLTDLMVPGTFIITATKGGYSPGGYGMYRPNGTHHAVTLDVTRPSADIVVRIWKLSAITGTVTDEAGEPIVGVQVRAIPRRAGATREFTGEPVAVRTDDRGVYRIHSLLPADYIVVASTPGLSATLDAFADVSRTGRGVGELTGMVSAGKIQGVRVGNTFYGARGSVTPPPPVGTRLQVYPPTFHPATTVPAQATIVRLASGEERESVDIHLTPVPTSRVSGTLLGAAGPVGGLAARLLPAGADLVSADMLGAVATVDSSGAFVFPAVTPGSYVLRAAARDQSGPTWLAMPMVVSGDDIDGIVATLQPGLKITSRTQYEGNAAGAAVPAGAGAPQFSLENEDGPAAVPVAPNGTLKGETMTFGGYPPGRYRVLVTSVPSGWMFKAAMLDGVDVSVTPFDFTRDVSDLVLVFTDRPTGVSGVVQGPRADRADVILFPTDSAAWTSAGFTPRRLRLQRADPQGRFDMRSVPPGEYYVVALPDEQSADWRQPSVLEALARVATTVTILDGEQKTLDVQIREVRQ